MHISTLLTESHRISHINILAESAANSITAIIDRLEDPEFKHDAASIEADADLLAGLSLLANHENRKLFGFDGGERARLAMNTIFKGAGNSEAKGDAYIRRMAKQHASPLVDKFKRKIKYYGKMHPNDRKTFLGAMHKLSRVYAHGENLLAKSLESMADKK